MIIIPLTSDWDIIKNYFSLDSIPSVRGQWCFFSISFTFYISSLFIFISLYFPSFYARLLRRLFYYSLCRSCFKYSLSFSAQVNSTVFFSDDMGNAPFCDFLKNLTFITYSVHGIFRVFLQNHGYLTSPLLHLWGDYPIFFLVTEVLCWISGQPTFHCFYQKCLVSQYVA